MANLTIKTDTTNTGTIGFNGTPMIVVNSDNTLTFAKSTNLIVGGGSDKGLFDCDTTINSNYTITSGKNAGTFGPVTIAGGVSVIVPSGSVWTIL